MLVIRERIVGNITRLAISTARREVVTRLKLKDIAPEMVSEDAVEKVAVAYLTDAMAQVKKRRPKL